MFRKRFSPGDLVVYRKVKYSASPGKRAREIHPAEQGENYLYTVDKFWVVSEVRQDGSLLLKTRRGKQHVVPSDDWNLRKANWWERWRFRNRFEAIAGSLDTDVNQRAASA